MRKSRESTYWKLTREVLTLSSRSFGVGGRHVRRELRHALSHFVAPGSVLAVDGDEHMHGELPRREKRCKPRWTKGTGMDKASPAQFESQERGLRLKLFAVVQPLRLDLSLCNSEVRIVVSLVQDAGVQLQACSLIYHDFSPGKAL